MLTVSWITKGMCLTVYRARLKVSATYATSILVHTVDHL